MVRRSGNAAIRPSESAASSGRLLAAATAGVSVIAITVPLSSACAIGPAPVNGTPSPSAPIALSTASIPRCGWLARPRMAVDEVFGLGLGEADEFIERLERRLRPCDQHIGRK